MQLGGNVAFNYVSRGPITPMSISRVDSVGPKLVKL